MAERHVEPADLLVTVAITPRMSGRALAERLGQARPGLRVLTLLRVQREGQANRGRQDGDAKDRDEEGSRISMTVRYGTPARVSVLAASWRRS